MELGVNSNNLGAIGNNICANVLTTKTTSRKGRVLSLSWAVQVDIAVVK